MKASKPEDARSRHLLECEQFLREELLKISSVDDLLENHTLEQCSIKVLRRYQQQQHQPQGAAGSQPAANDPNYTTLLEYDGIITLPPGRRGRKAGAD